MQFSPKNKTFKISCAFLFFIYLFMVSSFCKTFICDGVEYTIVYTDPDSSAAYAALSNGRAIKGNFSIPSHVRDGDNVYEVNEISPEAFTDSKILCVIIPETIKIIGRYAFSGTQHLTTVDFPGNSLRIMEHAFQSSGLNHLRIPDEVYYVGEGAFSNCNKLVSVSIGSGVQSIGSGDFSWCSALEKLHLSYGLRKVGDMAFYSCTSLKSVELPDSVTSVGKGVFSW